MNRYSLFFLWVFLPGCIGTIWQQYERPNYGPSRADLVCHPYGFCSPAQWVASVPGRDNSTSDLLACRDEIQQLSDGWSEFSVALGLEIGQCMQKKGYGLVSQ